MVRYKRGGRTYSWKTSKQDVLGGLNGSKETQEIARSHRKLLSTQKV